MEQLYYLNDSDEMIPGSSLIGDPESQKKECIIIPLMKFAIP